MSMTRRSQHSTGPGRSRLAGVGLLIAGLTGLAAAPPSTADAPVDSPRPAERLFIFTYDVTIPAQPPGDAPLDIFIPLPASDVEQDVLWRRIDADVPGEVRIEPEFGNVFWHARAEDVAAPLRVRIDSLVRRRGAEPVPEPRMNRLLPPTPHLVEPTALVPTDGPLVEPILEELPTRGTSRRRARAVYDYVIDHMEYKKVGEGWGRGSTEWACTARYGNCTDFHALFLSLVRAQGIPAYFEIGFPLPARRGAGAIGGYHCWARFLDGEERWIPLDASEAWKHPGKRDDLFGSLPSDRVVLTRGRDLSLGEGHTTGPLNYFVYPHVERNGEIVGGVDYEFSFADIGERMERRR